VPELAYPLRGAERIAVVGTRVRAGRGVRSFPYWSSAELEAWRPRALAGHRSELLALGELRRQAFIPLRDLCFPLLVFSALREGPLGAWEHDRLWNLYGLPVYEQIRGENEALLAWECDARDGWHVAGDAQGNPVLTARQLRTAGWDVELARGLCACGRTGPRIAPLVREERVRMASCAD
jgi:hypothetical protein